MQVFTPRQAFNRRNRSTLLHDGKGKTGINAFGFAVPVGIAIHQHRTGTTLTVIAAFFSACQSQPFP
jgi:hypothetical protein